MAVIACPECGRRVSQHAMICPHCGFTTPAEQQGCGCFGALGRLVKLVIVIVIGSLVGLWYFGRDPAQHRPPASPVSPPPSLPSPAPVAPPPAETSPYPSDDKHAPPGVDVILSRPGGAGNTLLADDADDVVVFLDRRPGDFGRFQALAEQDRVFGVANGTRARVIESRPGLRRVRIDEGPQKGREAWVEALYVDEDPIANETVEERAERERRRTIELRRDRRSRGK